MSDLRDFGFVIVDLKKLRPLQLIATAMTIRQSGFRTALTRADMVTHAREVCDLLGLSYDASVILGDTTKRHKYEPAAAKKPQEPTA